MSGMQMANITARNIRNNRNDADKIRATDYSRIGMNSEKASIGSRTTKSAINKRLKVECRMWNMQVHMLN